MRRFSWVRASTLLFLTAIASESRSQGLYSVQDLGPLSDLLGRSDSGPTGINSSGVVVGANVTGGAYHAMAFNGSWTDLGTLGGSESIAAGINDSGQIVGYSRTSSGTTNAFLWTPGATDGVTGNPQMKSLGTLGGAVSQAYAIDNLGQITGYSDVLNGGLGLVQHVFLYSNGQMTDMSQTLGNLVNSFGYGIAASGHIGGTAYNASYSTSHAVLFNGTDFVDLGFFGGKSSFALGMNNADHLVGYLTTTASVDHAFSYINQKAKDLGTLGGHYSYALAINNKDVVVGGSFIDSKDSIYHAFISTNGTLVDLNSLLDQSGAGWTLVEARAVNDAGQIAGIGNFSGANHGFLLNPVTTGIQPPRIAAIQVIGSSIVLQFTASAAAQYTVQTNATLQAGGWADWKSGLSGNGGSLSITNNSAIGAAARFYRVKVSP